MKRILPVLVILGFILVPAFLLFRVKTVEINENSCLNAAQADYKGKLLFVLSKSSIEKELKEKFICLSQIKVSKIYPSKLKIEVLAEKPSASIAGTNFYITSDGLVTENSAKDLPQLFLAGPLQMAPGRKITDKTYLSAAKIAALLAKSDFHATNIRVLATGDIAVYDAKEVITIFSPDKSPEEQIDSLQQVLALAKIDDDKIAKIDLRFDKPVIVYK